MIKVCEYCKKEFETNNPKRKFCSYKCSNANKIIDLTGKKFGRLTVIKFQYKKQRKNGGNEYYWLCKCDCGNMVIVRGSTLKNSATQSCGCLHKEISTKANTKHGKNNTKLYDIYYSMKQRCFNPKCNSYKNYGSRGIAICENWQKDFMNFYDWAINNGYKEGLTIERIDVNGDYEPKNCCWIEKSEQSKNTRANHYFTYNGKTQIVSDWAKEYGFKNASTLNYRIRHWEIEKALKTPVN